MSTTELAIGFLFPIMLMIIGYWKEEVWLFYIASVAWLAFMGFLFNNYGTDDFLYYIAFLCLALAIVCAMAQMWMNKGKPLLIEDEKPEPTLEERREQRNKKLDGLRDFGSRMRGR